MEKSFFPTSETLQKILPRCLERSKIAGHSQKTTNTRAAKTAKLNVACPKTLSKVHAAGARDLCAAQHRIERQRTKNHGVDAGRKCRPPKHKYVTLYATLPNVEREPWRATHKGNKTATVPSTTKEHARTSPARIGRGRHEKQGV